MRSLRVAWAMLVVPLVATSAATARAEPSVKDICVADAEEGQDLATKRRFSSAREKLLACSRSVCPPVIVRDCTKWLASVEESLSSVVFAARHADQDLSDVTVRVDGRPSTSTLDGRAIPIDPGTHALSFEWSGRRVEQRIVVAEGEKNRQVRIVFEDGPSDGAPTPARERRPVPAMTFVLGGVALAGFGTAIGFGTAGRRQLDRLHECAPSCASSEVSELRTDMVITNVSLGIGIVAAGIATWLFFTRPTVSTPTARAPGTLIW